jgi:hypothetical protein
MAYLSDLLLQDYEPTNYIRIGRHQQEERYFHSTHNSPATGKRH